VYFKYALLRIIKQLRACRFYSGEIHPSNILLADNYQICLGAFSIGFFMARNHSLKAGELDKSLMDTEMNQIM
jgi:hypothetical protein